MLENKGWFSRFPSLFFETRSTVGDSFNIILLGINFYLVPGNPLTKVKRTINNASRAKLVAIKRTVNKRTDEFVSLKSAESKYL